MVFAVCFATADFPMIKAASPPAARILFDDVHGQSFGNADWVPDRAYSEFASDLARHIPATIQQVSHCVPDERLTEALLAQQDLLILPEPNIRYTPAEITAVRKFVTEGGGLFLIADHGGSDRNMDGWDSSLILNEIIEPWGFFFTGSTFSRAPIPTDTAHDSPLLKGIDSVGAWAATSIVIESHESQYQRILPGEAPHEAYLITGNVNQGRIAAIGDSSPFDDGSGDITKNRHEAYISWLYDHRVLAVKLSAWLLNRSPNSLPAPIVPILPSASDIRDQGPDNSSGINIIIDAAHGNYTADIVDRFADDLKKIPGAAVFLNHEPLNHFTGWDIFITTNPTTGFTDTELQKLAKWIREDSGKLIVATNNARNPLTAIPEVNRILIHLRSGIRINADEVVDRENNTGKPWSMLIHSFPESVLFAGIDSAVFWGTASLITPDGKPLSGTGSIRIIAETAASAGSFVRSFFPLHGGIALPRNTKIPVAALDCIGTGTIIVIGSDTITNFQYPTENEKTVLPREKWDHRTSEFNLSLVKALKE